MSQHTLDDFESTGVECPTCNRVFESNKAFGPHFRAKHPDKDASIERIRDAYGGDPKEALEVWHHERGIAVAAISEQFGIPRDGLMQAFDKLGVERDGRGRTYASYRTNYNGYESWRSNDPDGVERLMKVHRLVAVAEHGVDEVTGKHIHHKNGVPWDNRPENLEVVEEREHLQEHYNEREIDEAGRFV